MKREIWMSVLFLEYLRSFEYFIDECEIYTDDNKFIENILKKLGESENPMN